MIFVTGREEPDTDDQLLVDANLDGPSPEMERLGIRWNSSDPRSLQPCLETGHDSIQQRRSTIQLGSHQYERDSQPHRASGVVKPWNISQQLRHQRRVLPFRRATMRPEMGLLDVRWIPTGAGEAKRRGRREQLPSKR